MSKLYAALEGDPSLCASVLGDHTLQYVVARDTFGSGGRRLSAQMQHKQTLVVCKIVVLCAREFVYRHNIYAPNETWLRALCKAINFHAVGLIRTMADPHVYGGTRGCLEIWAWIDELCECVMNMPDLNRVWWGHVLREPDSLYLLYCNGISSLHFLPIHQLGVVIHLCCRKHWLEDVQRQGRGIDLSLAPQTESAYQRASEIREKAFDTAESCMVCVVSTSNICAETCDWLASKPEFTTFIVDDQLSRGFEQCMYDFQTATSLSAAAGAGAGAGGPNLSDSSFYLYSRACTLVSRIGALLSKERARDAFFHAVCDSFLRVQFLNHCTLSKCQGSYSRNARGRFYDLVGQFFESLSERDLGPVQCTMNSLYTHFFSKQVCHELFQDAISQDMYDAPADVADKAIFLLVWVLRCGNACISRSILFKELNGCPHFTLESLDFLRRAVYQRHCRSVQTKDKLLVAHGQTERRASGVLCDPHIRCCGASKDSVWYLLDVESKRIPFTLLLLLANVCKNKEPLNIGLEKLFIEVFRFGSGRVADMFVPDSKVRATLEILAEASTTPGSNGLERAIDFRFAKLSHNDLWYECIHATTSLPEACGEVPVENPLPYSSTATDSYIQVNGDVPNRTLADLMAQLYYESRSFAIANQILYSTRELLT